jgi:hypothetical protein
LQPSDQALSALRRAHRPEVVPSGRLPDVVPRSQTSEIYLVVGLGSRKETLEPRVRARWTTTVYSQDQAFVLGLSACGVAPFPSALRDLGDTCPSCRGTIIAARRVPAHPQIAYFCCRLGVACGPLLPRMLNRGSSENSLLLQHFAVMLNHAAWVGVQMLSFRRSIQEDGGFH